LQIYNRRKGASQFPTNTILGSSGTEQRAVGIGSRDAGRCFLTGQSSVVISNGVLEYRINVVRQVDMLFNMPACPTARYLCLTMRICMHCKSTAEVGDSGQSTFSICKSLSYFVHCMLLLRRTLKLPFRDYSDGSGTSAGDLERIDMPNR
jgi:hypothetical protein